MTEQQRAVAYYGAALVCLAFGILGLASIGFPFLLVGIVLLAVGPVRRRRDVLWPPLTAIVLATVIYVTLAPVSCTAVPGSAGRCENLVGFELPGREVTALVIAVVLAVTVGVGLHSVLLRRITER
jgi:hypothetical protein